MEVDASECSSAAEIDLRMARSASAAKVEEEEAEEDDGGADATTGMEAADDEDDRAACRGDASAGCAAAANPSFLTLVVRARPAPLPWIPPPCTIAAEPPALKG